MGLPEHVPTKESTYVKSTKTIVYIEYVIDSSGGGLWQRSLGVIS
jgi:hypothetical protein